MALGPDGALGAFREAKDEGLIRFIGFSAHNEEAALRLMERFDFDTVLFPINWAYWLTGRRGEEVLRWAGGRNMGRIAMKALARRPWRDGEEKAKADFSKCWYRPIYDDPEMASLALRFTLSRDVHVALSPGDVRMLRLARHRGTQRYAGGAVGCGDREAGRAGAENAADLQRSITD